MGESRTAKRPPPRRVRAENRRSGGEVVHKEESRSVQNHSVDLDNASIRTHRGAVLLNDGSAGRQVQVVNLRRGRQSATQLLTELHRAVPRFAEWRVGATWTGIDLRDSRAARKVVRDVGGRTHDDLSLNYVATVSSPHRLA